MASPSSPMPDASTSTATSAGQMSRTIGQTLVGIPQFSGKSNENIKEFFSKIAQRARIDAWSENQTLAVVKYHLTGDAFRFLEAEPNLNADDVPYTILKNALIKKYARKVIPGQGIINLSKCIQKPKETIDQYATRLKIIGTQLLEENLSYDSNDNETAASKKRHERDLIHQFQKGVSEDIAKLIMMDITKNPQFTFEEVVDLAQKAEISVNILRQGNYSNDTFVVYKNENKYRNKDQSSTKINPEITCFNCQKKGHIARNCKIAKNIKCFTGGKMGHFSKNCYKNKASMNKEIRINQNLEPINRRI